MKKIYLLPTLLVSLFSCEQLNVEEIDQQTAVVEAYLVANQPLDSINIHQSFSFAQTDSNIIQLDQLSVLVSSDQGTYELENLGDGYYGRPEILVEQDQNYQLEFLWNGEWVSAQTYIPEKTEAYLSTPEIEMEKITSGFFGGGFSPVDLIDITWENPSGDYYYVVLKNIEEDPEYINENILNFDLQNGGRRRFFTISEPQANDFYTIDPRRELTQFGTYEIIVFRVNPEYAALYESSSNSSLSLEQPPTNVVNGLGIFTGLNSDTLYLEVLKK